MKQKRITVLLAAGLLLMSGVASAQFGGLGALTGAKGGAGASPELIVKKYVLGTQSVMMADSGMLAALGKKDQADLAALKAKNLTEGATKDALEDAAKVQSDSSKMLEQSFAGEKVELDAASKKQFSNGLLDLSKGVLQYVGMSKDVSGFKPGVSSLGASTNSALFIGKSLPGSIKSLGSTLKQAIAFSKANNIPVPKEAADATGALPD